MQYKPSSEEEKKFLEEYDIMAYPSPSVTVDIVVFTITEKSTLGVLLIKRGGFPYKDSWALPGGFLQMDESLEAAAARELKEETGLTNIQLEQIATFGSVNRDPRGRIISIAYMAFVPKGMLNIKAGDDASDAMIFEIRQDVSVKPSKVEIPTFYSATGTIEGLVADTPKELAFDHKDILNTALLRLRNKIDYLPVAFEFLSNKDSFTIYELRKIYETVKGRPEDASNFRKMFITKFVNKGFAEDTGDTTMDHSLKEAALYRVIRSEVVS